MNPLAAESTSNPTWRSDSILESSTAERKKGVLIVNADDLGNDESTTLNIQRCYQRGRISSASALVFMRDSERAADTALQSGLDVGLHLNFTLEPTGIRNKPLLEDFQLSLAASLARGPRSYLWYHPTMRRQFEYVCRAQVEEFQRLYGMEPSHVNGHRHVHLCANMLLDRILPSKFPIRRSFDFFRDEKGTVNRLCRRILNGWVSRNFISTDYFFDIEPIVQERLLRILALSRNSNVELMVHPERRSHQEYLMSDWFDALLRKANMGTWSAVGRAKSGGNSGWTPGLRRQDMEAIR